jgi:ferredoxin
MISKQRRRAEGGVMIVAERKPFDEILNKTTGAERVLIVGCGTCVAVCMSGGERQVAELASQLRLRAKVDGRELELTECSVERQCEPEMVDPLADRVAAADVVLSLGCGCGVQLLAERFPDAVVLPGLDTSFIGANTAEGAWEERCAMCGNCTLDITAGVCPVARCSKALLNGPCGGSEDGHCEIDDAVQCAWQMIYDRLERQGRLDNLIEIIPPKDWSTSRDGGPRALIRDEARLEKERE